MKRHSKTLLTLMIGISVTWAAFAIGSSYGHSADAQSGHDGLDAAVPPQHFREPSPPAHSHNAHRALAEMNEHGRRHLDDFHVRPGTFGGSGEWSHEWDLHWIVVVERDGRTIRIYHATQKDHPENRFLLLWDEHEIEPSRWERIH